MAVEAFAPAKINLALHIVGRRADGYHLLDSLVAFADLGDRITIARARETALHVTGPEAAGLAAGPDNLVLRATRLAGAPPLAITLEKNLPVAAGIGGGSSDAAATLRAVSALTGRPAPRDLLALGADVPVCHAGRGARMQGVGEILTPLPGLPVLNAVLVNPRVAVATSQVFRLLTDSDNPPMPETIPGFADAAALVDWLAAQRNDLQSAAIGLHPAIGRVLAEIGAAPGCLLARMSGSGATCFGLFGDRHAADAAAIALRQVRPDWWVQACRIS